MPADEHRWLKATGNLIIRPEVEEIEEAFHRVKPGQLQDMCKQFRYNFMFINNLIIIWLLYK
jgi:hypothetical protein